MVRSVLYAKMRTYSLANPRGLTRNRGQSPLGVVAECSLCFRRRRPIRSRNRTFWGFCPVVKASFASLQHPPVVALRLPPANGSDPSGIPMRDATGAGQASKSVPQALQPRIGQHRADRTRTSGTTPRQGLGRAFPSLGSR